MTSLGYQLYALRDDSATSATRWNAEDASTKELRAYRSYILSEEYRTHPFFSLETPEVWISPLAFQAYMVSRMDPGNLRRESSSPVSHRGFNSCPSSAISVIEFHDSDSEPDDSPAQPETQSNSSLPIVVPKSEETPVVIPRNPAPANSVVARGTETLKIRITREETVDQIVYPTAIALSFDVPNQEYWDGSAGHTKGDVNVYGFPSADGITPDLKTKIGCRRVSLTCNGIDKCEFPDPTLFAGLERFEADEETMRELWNHELDKNEAEAASPFGIIAQYAARRYSVHHSSVYGKQHFIGCSKWTRSETGQHLYWPMPPNVDEDILRYVMENEGRLPSESTTINNCCILTVHPRVQLSHCSYSHIIGGQIVPATIEHCLCNIADSPATRHKAIVILRNPHNHPINPPTKPTAQGVIYHLNTWEAKLSKAEQYIRTAIELKARWTSGKSWEWWIDTRSVGLELSFVYLSMFAFAGYTLALGLATFLSKYNNPEISGIWTSDPVRLLYKHKLANLWILPSINKCLSKIVPEDWDITPNHSNYVESGMVKRR
ncbi:hypothetical protein B0H14DRAFT_2559794 [Mycena olivaceomarginata]|nr:hypothetical protein B0H14DRAFT_2559794 [Mycena olivaceomarginata]